MKNDGRNKKETQKIYRVNAWVMQKPQNYKMNKM